MGGQEDPDAMDPALDYEDHQEGKEGKTLVLKLKLGPNKYYLCQTNGMEHTATVKPYKIIYLFLKHCAGLHI